MCSQTNGENLDYFHSVKKKSGHKNRWGAWNFFSAATKAKTADGFAVFEEGRVQV